MFDVTHASRKMGWLLRASVPFYLVMSLAVLGANAVPGMAQGDAMLPALDKPAVTNGEKPGEVIISWNAVPSAEFYRIGWVSRATPAELGSQSTSDRLYLRDNRFTGCTTAALENAANDDLRRVDLEFCP